MADQQSMDRDHVVLLDKIDKIILHAEGLEVETGLRKRMYALRNLMVIHSQKAQDIKDEIASTITKNKTRILIFGPVITGLIVVPYLLLTRTTLSLHYPIICKEFATTSFLYPGKIEVCINGITRSYSPLNGDVELDLTFMQSETERVQADVVFWIADEIAGKAVDYSGEYNIDRIRIYSDHLLVSDDETKVSGWTKPLVPSDVRMPLWHWVYHCRNRFTRDRPPIEEKLENLIRSLGPAIGAIGGIGVTIYRFLRAG